jgi:hypothetical protein
MCHEQSSAATYADDRSGLVPQGLPDPAVDAARDGAVDEPAGNGGVFGSGKYGAGLLSPAPAVAHGLVQEPGAGGADGIGEDDAVSHPLAVAGGRERGGEGSVGGDLPVDIWTSSGAGVPGAGAAAASLAENGAGNDAFWVSGATNILYICLRALMAVEDAGYRNLANLRWLLNHFGVHGEGANGFMSRYLDAVTFAEYKGFISQDTKVIAGMLSSARAALDLWSDPEIAVLTARDSMAIGRMREEPTVTYLIVPEDEMDYFVLILNLFYTVCFRHCLREWDAEDGERNDAKLPVFFFLDEFGNLGKIRRFPSVITTLRKRRCSVSLILQDLAQLRSLYGREGAETIFAGGCGSKLFFSGMDTEMCDYVARTLGQNTEYDTLYEGISEHARTVAKPLMRADEVRMLAPGHGILISGRERPVLVKMPAFHEPPVWKRLAKKPAAAFVGETEERRVRYLPLGEENRAEAPVFPAASGFFRGEGDGGKASCHSGNADPIGRRRARKESLGSPLNRSKLMRWITLLPAFTILVPWASFRAGSGPMRTAWTTWSGCVGRMVSSARAAATMEAGGSAMVGSCARGAVAVRR